MPELLYITVDGEKVLESTQSIIHLKQEDLDIADFSELYMRAVAKYQKNHSVIKVLLLYKFAHTVLTTAWKFKLIRISFAVKTSRIFS